MRSPFPGMDPYLEHPSLWPDWHNSLIISIANSLTPLITPRYYTALERRTNLLRSDDPMFVGRPGSASFFTAHSLPLTETAVLEVDVPINDEVGENYLEVHEVATGKLVTILELLSPANKLHDEGRRQYEQKRDSVFRTGTNLVEVDLLRAGEPMPVTGKKVRSDYRILVSRGHQRPHAQLYVFDLRQPMPLFPLPLLPGDDEPPVDLNAILHALYERARFDLRLDYSQPPVPPLGEQDSAWAQKFLTS